MVHLQQRPVTLGTDPFKKQLETLAQDVETTLDQILPPPTTRLHAAMRYTVLDGGKRLRPYFVYHSCELFGISPSISLKVAAAIEIIHSYSLVHDDLPCMDNADFRRGKPSCHKAYDAETATLVGDALIPLAYQILSSLEVSPDIRLNLMKTLSEAIGSQGLVAGQMIDLRKEKPLKTFEDLLQQERLKTGVLFAFSAESGAILNNESKERRERLRSYGFHFGRAFQMVDDWLDHYGDEATLGKPCYQDIEKLTFLSLLGKEKLVLKVHETLDEAFLLLEPFGDKAAPLKALMSFLRSKL